ncbi:MAG: MATE family efflux transporter [Ignavibacteriota bacterium]|nr:MATE family efflux transporter [Ignavibacteriota bacterium]
MSDRRTIFNLALPAVLQTVVRSLFIIVDAFWVGKMGAISLAALTTATFLVWGFLALGEMIATGTNSLVAQSTGAGNHELTKRISTFNLVNTFFYTVVLSLVLIPIIPLLYSLMNVSGEQARLSNEYLVTLLIGFPGMTLLSTATSIFRGAGDTKTPMYLLIFAVVLNFFLAPLFMFGLWFVPAFGMTGAALSTLTAYSIAFVISYFIMKKRDLICKLSKYKINKPVILETFRIGFPIALNGVGFSLIYVFVSRFVADYGTVAFAALGIGHRSESLAYQITVGFSLASSILVGQNIGAGNPERAAKLAWKILGFASLVMFGYGLLLFIFSADVARIFINDADVINAASVYNKIAASVLIFSAAEVILSGAFSGAGDSLPPAIVGLPMNALRIPLTALFSMLWGLNGIWIAICSTVILKGIIITIWFRLGRWKTRKLVLK